MHIYICICFSIQKLHTLDKGLKLCLHFQKYILNDEKLKVPPQGVIFFCDGSKPNFEWWIILHELCPVFCIFRSKIKQQKMSHWSLYSSWRHYRVFFYCCFLLWALRTQDTTQCVHQRTWSTNRVRDCAVDVQWRPIATAHPWINNPPFVLSELIDRLLSLHQSASCSTSSLYVDLLLVLRRHL